MWGATPVSESVAEVVTERTGVRWLPAYGASEVPVIAANPVERPDAWRLDSAGLPPAGVELRIADLDTGDVLDRADIGEIQVRSPSVMAGYLPDEATADAFADGWYRTGDVGWLEPEGWVHLTDRSKEMIKVNGFQVAPAELEAVLLRSSGRARLRRVRRRRRAGRRGARGRRASSTRTIPVADGELQQLVADSLATYKRLHHVVVVDDDPAPAVGQGAAPHAPRRVVGVARCRAGGQLMDVRLSPEQQALRDSAARIVDRLGPHAVGELDDAERAAKLDAAVAASGWRELRTATDEGAPLASGVEAASSPRSSAGDWPTSPSSDRPWPASSADWPAPRRPDRRDGRPDGRSLVAGVRPSAATVPPAVAIDVQGSARRLVLVPGSDGYVLARGRPARRPGRESISPARRRCVGPPLAVRRPSRRTGPISRRRPDPLDGARPVAGLRRPGRDHARRRASWPRTYATQRRQYGAAHRLLPGRPASAGRRLGADRGIPQRDPARGLGRGRARPGRGAGRRRGGQGLLRPGRP